MDEENELNDDQNEKAGTVKIIRSLNLKTNFENGYAQGWYFAVGECFKDQLDIKYTQRIKKIKKNNKIQYENLSNNDGNPLINKDLKIKDKENKIEGVWTQGLFYCFSEG